MVLIGCVVWAALAWVACRIVPDFMDASKLVLAKFPRSTQMLSNTVDSILAGWQVYLGVWAGATVVFLLVFTVPKSRGVLRGAVFFGVAMMVLEQLAACAVAFSLHAAARAILDLAAGG
jgi:type II secretory pathway component PulF